MAAVTGPRRGYAPGVLKPRYCVWELTQACNLRCGHCGSRAGRPRPDELDTEACFDVIRSLARLGCQVVTLSGGEPLLRRDWAEIAAEIRSRGMIPNMVSNGIGVTEAVVRQMRGAGLANVAVSLDGPQDVHDQIRGRGSYAKTVTALARLKSAGLPTTVMTTLNTLNLNRLEDCHAIAVAVGADRWRTQLGKPMGSMQDNQELVIAPEDLLTALPRLYDLHMRREIEVSIGDSLGYFGPYDSALRAQSWDGKPQRWGGCQAGLQALGIESNGGVKGCLSLQALRGADDPFVEGNLRVRALESIWLDPDSFSYNRCFEADSLGGFCRGCAHSQLCRGGARCVAVASTGDLAEDPYCYHRVSSLASRRAGAGLRKQIATAASIFSLLGSGCGAFGPELPEPGQAKVAEPDCEEICCDCGDALEAEIAELCCPDPAARYGIGIPADGDAPAEDVGDCADCDYGSPPPPVDCSEVCCECDYGEQPPEYEACCGAVFPPYGVSVEEVCLSSEEICAEFDCQSGCEAVALDYGVPPPPLPEECGICCEPVVAPAYGIDIEPHGQLEVARFGLDLSPQGETVAEDWMHRPVVEGRQFPSDVSLAAWGDGVRLGYQQVASIQHDDTCGYCLEQQGCLCQPSVGICTGEAPATRLFGPVDSIIDGAAWAPPLITDELSLRLLLTPTPELGALVWGRSYIDEGLGVCQSGEQVSLVQEGGVTLERTLLGRFVQAELAWVEALSLLQEPAALIMKRNGELALFTVGPSGLVETRLVAAPTPLQPAEGRVISTEPNWQAAASAPLVQGAVVVAVTRPGAAGGAPEADPVPESPYVVPSGRLAVFTIGCQAEIPSGP